jgi:hypothetical protein
MRRPGFSAGIWRNRQRFVAVQLRPLLGEHVFQAFSPGGVWLALMESFEASDVLSGNEILHDFVSRRRYLIG